MDIGDAGPLIKEVIRGTVIECTQKNHLGAEHMADAPEERMRGTKIEFPLHLAGNYSFAMRSERQALPTGDRQKFGRISYKPKYAYLAIDLSIQAILQVSDEGAIEDALESETTRIVDDGVRELNRIANGDGTGRLAEIVGLANTGALAGNDALKVNSMKFIAVGQLIELALESNGTRYGGKFRIVATDRLNKEFQAVVAADDSVPDFSGTGLNVPSGGVTPATRASVFRWGSRDPLRTGAGWGIAPEPWGFGNIADTDTHLTSHGITGEERVGGISAEAHDRWRPIVQNAGGVISFRILEEFRNAVMVHGEMEPPVGITSHVGYMEIGDLFTNTRRQVNVSQLEGGQQGISYGGMGIFPERDVYDPMTSTWDQTTAGDIVPLYIADLNVGWNRGMIQDWNWVDGFAYGGMLRLQTNSEGVIDAYEGHLRRVFQHCIVDANRNAKLTFARA